MEDSKGRKSGKYVWPKDLVLRLIQLWRKYEFLYNPEHPLYYSRSDRKYAVNQMANDLKKYYPDVTPSEIKYKLRYLRSTYTREINWVKEKRVRKNGENYVPSLYWFWHVEFLEKGSKEKQPKSNKLNAAETDDSSESLQKVIERDESPIEEFTRSRLSTCTSTSSGKSQKNPGLLPRYSASLDKVQMSCSSNGDNDFNKRDEAFCNYIKMELNEITNRNIEDDLTEKILLAIFVAKNKQRKTF